MVIFKSYFSWPDGTSQTHHQRLWTLFTCCFGLNFARFGAMFSSKTYQLQGWTQAAPRHPVASPSRTDRNSPSVHSNWRPPGRCGSRHPMNFGMGMFFGLVHPWMLIPIYHYTHLHALLYVFILVYIYTCIYIYIHIVVNNRLCIKNYIYI